NYVRIRIWTFTDNCGNTSPDFIQTISVQDNTAPVLTCPSSMTIQCSSDPLPAFTGFATATDNCDPDPVITYTDMITLLAPCMLEFNIERLWTVTDACNNSSTCIQSISVVGIPPVCQTQDITVGLDPVSGIATITPEQIGSAVGGCGAVTMIVSPSSFSCSNAGQNVVVFTVSDACGNSSSCTAIVTVTGCADLSLTKTGVYDNTVNEATFTIIVNNSGPDGATGIIASDPLPSGYTYISHTVSQGDYIASTGIWTIGSLANASNATLTIVASGNAIGDHTNRAQIIHSDQFDPDSDPMTDENTDDLNDGLADDDEASVTLTISACIQIYAWVYIEGSTTLANGQPFNYLPMRTTLNDLRVLPGQTMVDAFNGNYYCPPGQPYFIAPWNYIGTEGDAYDSNGNPSFADAGYPPTVTDWVLVSLRDNPEGLGGPVCEAAALLHRDGHIEFVEPFTCCDIDVSATYYLVIEHRSHLIVMSDVSVPVISNTITYDFRAQQSYIDDPAGTGLYAGEKEILPGIFAMFAGNGDQTSSNFADTDTNFGDLIKWQNQSGYFGRYFIADYNMNGDVNFNDLFTFQRNNGRFTSVPRN
ncbi:MAG: DUF11 domain-containing protein, partial [Saprospiraceae bacterium]